MNATHATVLAAGPNNARARLRFAFPECELALVAISVWCVALPLELVWLSV